MNKKGRLIALFGPDGSGKSTIADILGDICHNHNVKTYHYHWRPRLLPSLIHAQNSHFDNTRPNDLPTRPWLISFGIYIYFWLDFLLANIFKFRTLLRQGAIIIYERYYYDLLFHPKRYRVKQINMLGNLFAFIVPRPDLIVLLTGEPSIILSRKPELPLNEIMNQQKKMVRYLLKFGGILHIDVTITEPFDVAQIIYRRAFKNELATSKNHDE